MPDGGQGSPDVTKDGTTVAEDVEPTDPSENTGAQLVKEAASKTSDVAGDGTTTAAVLAGHVFRGGPRAVAAGHDAVALVRGIQNGADEVVEELHKLAERVDPKDPEGITEVATISADNVREIGRKLAGAMKKVGANGVIRSTHPSPLTPPAAMNAPSRRVTESAPPRMKMSLNRFTCRSCAGGLPS